MSEKNNEFNVSMPEKNNETNVSLPGKNSEIDVGTKIVDENSMPVVRDLDGNKTIYADTNLRGDQCTGPALFKDIKTIDQALQTLKPEKEIILTDEKGREISETLTFNSMEDFLPDNLILKSPILYRKAVRLHTLQNLLRKIKDNPQFYHQISNSKERKVLSQQAQQIDKYLSAPKGS